MLKSGEPMKVKGPLKVNQLSLYQADLIEVIIVVCKHVPVIFYLHLTESLSQHTSQNKVMAIINLHQSDNSATERRSSVPNRIWAQQFG